MNSQMYGVIPRSSLDVMGVLSEYCRSDAIIVDMRWV